MIELLRSVSLKLAVKAMQLSVGYLFRFCLGFYLAGVWIEHYKLDVVDEVIFVVGKFFLIVHEIATHGQLRDALKSLFDIPINMLDETYDQIKNALVGFARLCFIAILFLWMFAIVLAAFALLMAIIQKLFIAPEGANFASPREVAAAQNPQGSNFGYYHRAPLRLHTEKHALIMASTRSGKGVSIIIPHLLRYPGSAFVLDPKGENARATGRQRAKLNKQAHYLDPFGISGKPKSRFNPLSRFTPENMEAESKSLAAALFTTRERDHWTASGQQLLAAFILYVYASDTFPPATKDLVMVRKLLLGSAPETLTDMKKSEVADGLVKGLAASFLNTPENERGSIISSAQRETEILDNPDIAACLAADGDAPEVDFSAWHRETMTVYLCLSAPKFPVFNRWLRLVLTSALDEMTDRLDPPPLPTCFMLDELATLGHFEPVENAIGLAAGYGVQLFSVFQDVAQMKDLYRGRWASFIGNAGIRAVFNLDDYDTAHYWSDFLGGRVAATKSQSLDVFGITQGYSAGQMTEPLVTADELMRRYTANKMLIIPQGGRPIEVDRVPYFLDPELAGFWDDPRGPVPLAT